VTGRGLYRDVIGGSPVTTSDNYEPDASTMFLVQDADTSPPPPSPCEGDITIPDASGRFVATLNF
jgi:hypothetical protein